MRCTCLWRHYAHTRAVRCSWCTLEWLGYPYDESVIAKAIIGREGIGVASRFLTTKILSVLLVAVVWLQHTRCPRFRRGTFGYGRTTSPTREVEYEYGVFMRMHVSMPKVPKCICYAIHAKKWHEFLFISREQDQKEISSGLRNQLDLWLAQTFWTNFEVHHGTFIWSQLAQIIPYKDHCGMRCLI
jgi:hypothetical protein